MQEAMVLPTRSAPVRRRAHTARLTPLDRGFLYLDWFGHPPYVGFLNVYTLPAGASPDFVRELAERLRGYSRPTRPFDRRLQSRYGEYWVEDEHFDIDQHLLRVSVTRPGNWKTLTGLLSDLHTIPLDYTRPLWRIYLIEGLSEGRIATYCKMHHAVADGVAGTRLLLRSMSAGQDQEQPPPWAVPASPERPNGAPALPALGGPRWPRRFFTFLNALPAVVSEAYQTRRDRVSGDRATVGGDQAPACLLNQRISDAREFAARSYPLPRIRELCATFNCTINDIVLALCAAALRRFLLNQDALPERPLIALVPMSRRCDDSSDGNRVVPLLVNLGTDQADPVERLHSICASAERSIGRMAGRTAAEAYGYVLATSSRGLLKLLFKPSAGNLAFNVVISKVPGPRSPMYWQGCRLVGMYPVSVLMDGLALNITVAMRDDALDFGVIACPQALPGMQRLLVYLEDALKELELHASRLEESPAAPVSLEAALHERAARAGASPESGAARASRGANWRRGAERQRAASVEQGR